MFNKSSDSLAYSALLQRTRSLIMPLLTLLLSLLLSSNALADIDWEHYKARFLASDGRIIDTGNQNISHTEGQGFAMLFSVAADDKESFDVIWQWTQKHLRNPATGLFYWRYDPAKANPIEDTNNASDGDVLIAWALLKAGNKWGKQEYLSMSDSILKSLLKYTIVDFAGKKVMLPAKDGFSFDGYINLNPSYFIFPAFRDFAQRTHLYDLWQLISDTQQLLEQIDWGNNKIPTDWVTLYADGKTAPARQWPARISYDAIRVPLYLIWDLPKNQLLVRWRKWFGHHSRLQTPAWENVYSHRTANYMMNGGLLAVRDLTMGELSASRTKINRKDDYYSASLKLLSALAQQRF